MAASGSYLAWPLVYRAKARRLRSSSSTTSVSMWVGFGQRNSRRGGGAGGEAIQGMAAPQRLVELIHTHGLGEIVVHARAEAEFLIA